MGIRQPAVDQSTVPLSHFAVSNFSVLRFIRNGQEKPDPKTVKARIRNRKTAKL